MVGSMAKRFQRRDRIEKVIDQWLNPISLFKWLLLRSAYYKGLCFH